MTEGLVKKGDNRTFSDKVLSLSVSITLVLYKECQKADNKRFLGFLRSPSKIQKELKKDLEYYCNELKKRKLK